MRGNTHPPPSPRAGRGGVYLEHCLQVVHRLTLWFRTPSTRRSLVHSSTEYCSRCGTCPSVFKEKNSSLVRLSMCFNPCATHLPRSQCLSTKPEDADVCVSWSPIQHNRTLDGRTRTVLLRDTISRKESWTTTHQEWQICHQLASHLSSFAQLKSFTVARKFLSCCLCGESLFGRKSASVWPFLMFVAVVLFAFYWHLSIWSTHRTSKRPARLALNPSALSQPRTNAVPTHLLRECGGIPGSLRDQKRLAHFGLSRTRPYWRQQPTAPQGSSQRFLQIGETGSGVQKDPHHPSPLNRKRMVLN